MVVIIRGHLKAANFLTSWLSHYKLRVFSVLVFTGNLTLKEETFLCYIRDQCGPRSKHSTSVIKTNLLIKFKAKVTLCFKIHIKYINAM